jgi:large subunit ribosomal protein L14|tara:strand:+ start:744 stop:1127 length:384 start_codon:yes stop_codon:yes gene_type:complete
MIQTQTLLKVSDNSGGKSVRCLKLLKKGNNPKIASVGDVIVVSVQNIRFKNRLTSKVKKGDVLYAVVVKTKSKLYRKTGLSFSFDTNSVVLLSNQRKPLGTRIFGAIPQELREKKFSKVISLASGSV